MAHIFSGVVTRSAPAVRPAVTAIEVPSVFLVRESSQLPLLAIALQAARRAHIVAEAPSTIAISPGTRSPGIISCRWRMAERVTCGRRRCSTPMGPLDLWRIA